MIFKDEEIIEASFRYFRQSGFPYRKLPIHVCMQELNKLSQLSDDKLATSTLCYQVADTFHPERFSTPVTGMKTPIQAFNDDKILRRCLTRMLTKGTGIKETLIGGVGGIAITSGTQAAANFRPAYALKMYRKYCRTGNKVLDTCAGFGGRMLGAMAFPDIKYIGFDPSKTVFEGNKRMALELGFKGRVVLYNMPIEDYNTFHMPAYADFAFTSCPYFTKEKYEDNTDEYGNVTQSWARYPDALDWKKGFLDKMMVHQFKALNLGSYAAVNIEDVTIKGKSYPLVEWCKDSAYQAGFTFNGVDTFQLQKRIGSGHEDSAVAEETVLIFKKIRSN